MPFLLIDKPAGITSHDVVDRLRRITGERTIGHAGTLDPFATGLLIVAVGRDATKHLQKYVGMEKEYEAEIRLGETTPTLDPESEIIDQSTREGHRIIVTKDELKTAIKNLTGEIAQIPPMHSAIKKGGKKMYELARKGIEVELEPRPVTIHEFKLTSKPAVDYRLPVTISVRIKCSSGTYIRALARDLGKNLGAGGYLSALRRTKIGKYGVKDAANLKLLTATNWIDSAQNDMLPSE
ncbi:MAG TPA: tRNA pseudouridine(55) synthase TruB [bacterium]|nr:tRNA pseudouridine(55) synthase TruB [bacterium]